MKGLINSRDIELGLSRLVIEFLILNIKRKLSI